MNVSPIKTKPIPVRPYRRFMDSKQSDTGMDRTAIYARAIRKESNLDNFRGEERRGTLNHIGKS